jgi:hypothetical protein
MSKVFIGIDVGINGAAVAVDEYGKLVGTTSLPHVKNVPCYRKDKTRSELDVIKFYLWLNSFKNVKRICVEESPSYGMGVTSAYTSGYNSGALATACLLWSRAKKCRFTTVAPRAWQLFLFGEIQSESNQKWSKERSIRLAQMEHGTLMIFDKPKKTADGYADASHIAEFCRLTCDI